jgi:hypothetical protein
VTDDDGATATASRTIRVEPASPSDGPTVAVRTGDATLSVDEETAVPVVLSTSPDRGLAAFDLNVTLDGADAVEVVDVRYPPDRFALTPTPTVSRSDGRIEVSLDGIDAADTVTPDRTAVTLAWLDLRGASAGEVSLDVDVTTVTDETRTEYAVASRATSLRIAAPDDPPSGSDPATVVVGYDAAGVGLDTYDVALDTPGTNATVVAYEPGIERVQVLNDPIGNGSIRARSFLRGEPTGAVPLYEVTFDRPVDRADLSVAVHNVSGEGWRSVSTDRVSLWMDESPFSQPVPGGSGSAPPTDTDGDGKLEDLTGDGQFGFADVVEFVFALQDLKRASLTARQRTALDHDGDGRVGFTDAVDLVFQLGA